MTEKEYRNLDEQAPEWYITSQASFWDNSRREKPGIPLGFSGEFDWAGSHWIVPEAYSCGKALVVDFCRQVEPEAMESFMKKWGLTPENDDISNFTKEQTLRMESESPMEFSFHPTAVVSGKELKGTRGSGVGYLPFLIESAGEMEAYWTVRHYGLDPEKAWHIWRYSFPWSRRREVQTLSLQLEAEDSHLLGTPFQIQPGERVEVTHPMTGKAFSVTALELQQETMGDSGFPGLEDWEVPTHCWKLTYALELPEEAGSRCDFTLEDTQEGDQMRPKLPKKGETRSGGIAMASSVGIIGGVDGPTTIFLGKPQQPQHLMAYSGLRFEPVETVTWMPVFREKPAEDITITLSRKN